MSDIGSQDTVLADTQALVPVSKGVPVEKVTAIDTQAKALVAKALEGGDNRDLIDQVRNLGLKAEQHANQQIALLEPRVATALREVQAGEVTGLEKLPELRSTMDRVNPHKLSQPKWYDSILNYLPWLSQVPAVRTLKTIAYRYETVNDQINAMLNDFMESGEDRLRDNIELEKLIDELAESQEGVRQNAYLAEALIVELRAAHELNGDKPEVQQYLNKLMYVTSIRARDLRTLEAVNEQLLTSLDIVRDTNFGVAENVRRAAGLTRNALRVGISIQLALQKQKATIEATKELMGYTEDMIVGTAKAAGDQAVETAKMLSQPLVQIGKLQEAFDASTKALQEVAVIQAATIEQAALQSQQLAAMAETNRQNRNGLELPAADALKSIEA